MKSFLTAILLVLYGVLSAQISVGSVHFGGSNADLFISHSIYNSKVYIAGASMSDDFDLNSNAGEFDAWYLAVDENGDTVFSYLMAGSLNDVFTDIIPGPTSAMVLVGRSASVDGDFIGISNYGMEDAIFAGVDTMGDFIVLENFGGNGDDNFSRVKRTIDAGFIMCGESASDSDDLPDNYGASDAWLMRLSFSVSKVWSYNYGGESTDKFCDLYAAADGNFYAFGKTYSTTGDISGQHGDSDYWLTKINSMGSVVWSRVYGGTDTEEAFCLVPCSEGNLLLCGGTESSDMDVPGNNAGGNLWFVKTDLNGDTLWTKIIGWGNGEWLISATEVRENLYLALIATDAGPDPLYGDFDIILVLFDQYNTQYLGHYGGLMVDGIGEGPMGKMDYDDADDVLRFTSVSWSSNEDLPGNYGNVDGWLFAQGLSIDAISEFGGSAEMSVWPMPATGYVNIMIDGPSNATNEVFLIDQQARVVRSWRLNSGSATLDITGISSGYYVLCTESGLNTKLIIQ